MRLSSLVPDVQIGGILREKTSWERGEGCLLERGAGRYFDNFTFKVLEMGFEQCRYLNLGGA